MAILRQSLAGKRPLQTKLVGKNAFREFRASLAKRSRHPLVFFHRCTFLQISSGCFGAIDHFRYLVENDTAIQIEFARVTPQLTAARS